MSMKEEITKLIEELKLNANSNTHLYYNKFLDLIGNNHNGTYYNEHIDAALEIIKQELSTNKDENVKSTLYEILIELFYFEPDKPDQDLNNKVRLYIYDLEMGNENFKQYLLQSDVDFKSLLKEDLNSTM